MGNVRVIQHKEEPMRPRAIKLPSKRIRRMITLTILNAMWLSTAPIWFHLAEMQRGYKAIGGELFLMALPYLVYLIAETVREIRA